MASTFSRAILHDPERYPEPDVFKPERFLDLDGSLLDDPVLASGFGYGKRICPGRHFVDATLFITVASLLSVFNIEKGEDTKGQPFEYTYTGHIIRFADHDLSIEQWMKADFNPQSSQLVSLFYCSTRQMGRRADYRRYYDTLVYPGVPFATNIHRGSVCPTFDPRTQIWGDLCLAIHPLLFPINITAAPLEKKEYPKRSASRPHLLIPDTLIRLPPTTNPLITTGQLRDDRRNVVWYRICESLP